MLPVLRVTSAGLVVAGVAAASSPPFDGKLRLVADGSVEAYMVPPYASNHASTLEVLPDGTLALAWFSGAAEEAPGCAIVVATLAPGADEWSQAITVSKDDKFSNQNPVLFYDTKGALLHLFHSHAPANAGESGSTIFHLTSSDEGKTWTEPEEWLSAHGGFPRNRIIEAPDGGVIFPFYNASKAPDFSNENYAIMGVSNKDRSWDVTTWDFIPVQGSADLVQPTVVQMTPNRSLVSFFRDRRAKSIYRAEVRSRSCRSLFWPVTTLFFD
jgi:predicted neuraminidase